MRCYECAREGRVETAVALCRSCLVGLCARHRELTASAGGPGGTAIGCMHEQPGCR